jgi:hypothetical protein
MSRERCEKCGESHPAGAGRECAPEAKAMADPPENGSFDEKAWKKNYQREYMRRKRERLRREKAEALKQKPEVGTDGSEKPSQENQKASESA